MFYIQKRPGIIRQSAKLTERASVPFRAVDLPHDFILISSSSEPFLLYYPTPLYPRAITELHSTALLAPPSPPPSATSYFFLCIFSRDPSRSSLTSSRASASFPSFHFPSCFPRFVTVFALHRASIVFAIGCEIIDKNLPNNSIGSRGPPGGTNGSKQPCLNLRTFARGNRTNRERACTCDVVVISNGRGS